MRSLSACLLLMWASSAHAQMLPQPGEADPRIRTAEWFEGQDYILPAAANMGLTVILEPGEWIERIEVSDLDALNLQIADSRDSFIVVPRTSPVLAQMNVRTDRRTYPLSVRTADMGAEAYIVRFTYGEQRTPQDPTDMSGAASQLWSYRLRGDSEVMPSRIEDDGVRTRITYAPGQALPAVFAIGPTGEEEVVNGHMRGGIFTIDRVYGELVFRIDKERARALRNAEPDAEDG